MPAPKTLRHVQVCPSNFRLTAALAGCINHCLIVDFDTVSHPLATHSAKMLRPMADGELLIETYVGDEGVAMVLPVSDTWSDSHALRDDDIFMPVEVLPAPPVLRISLLR
jgi:hypothetical protein